MIIFFSLITYSSFAQPGDLILLQKKNKTIETYYSGNHISFTTTSGSNIDADIVLIKNDTIYLKQLIIQQVPTTLGVYMSDTLGSYHYEFNYNQIKTINSTKSHFNVSASGASLLGGGVLLALGEGVESLADKKYYSSKLLIAGVALAATGYIIMQSSSKGITIGKKYKLVYIDASNNKK